MRSCLIICRGFLYTLLLSASMAHAGVWLGGSFGYAVADTSIDLDNYKVSATFAEKGPEGLIEVGYSHQFTDKFSFSTSLGGWPLKSRESKIIHFDLDLLSRSINLDVNTSVLFHYGFHFMPIWRIHDKVNVYGLFGGSLSRVKLDIVEMSSAIKKYIDFPAVYVGLGSEYIYDDHWRMGLRYMFTKFSYTAENVTYHPFKQESVATLSYHF